MQALIDGDICAYRSAASCEKAGDDKVRRPDVPVEIAIARCDDLMYRILQETGSTSYRVFLSAGETFRHRLYPAYKANRATMARPEYLQAVREHLLHQWNVELAIDIEADDKLGIYQSDNSVICSIDKDLLQVPGQHYNFVKNEFYNINEVDGMRHFWFQMIMGDRADNVPGYDGKMRQTVPKFLQSLIDDLYRYETYEEMETLVKDVYTDEEQFKINKILFHILREEPEGETP